MIDTACKEERSGWKGTEENVIKPTPQDVEYFFILLFLTLYIYFIIINIMYIMNRELAQRKKKKETGLQLLVTAKTITYCSRQILCQTKVQQPKIEALLKF